MIDMTGRKICCFAAMMFYVFYVLTCYKPFEYRNLFAGVEYNGYILFYAATLFLFGIVVFYGFGDVEKYVTGYGILELTRTKKRSSVIKKTVISEVIKSVEISIVIMTIYTIGLIIIEKNPLKSDIPVIMTDMGIFALVSFSIMLWQALFEIIWDSRSAIIISLGIVMIHLFAGDMIFINEGNKYLNLLFNANSAIVFRREMLGIDIWIVIFALITSCIVQIILICFVFYKKDIYTVRV